MRRRPFSPDDTPPEVVEFYRRAWGLDKPLYEQYLIDFKSVFRGTWASFRDNRTPLRRCSSEYPQRSGWAAPP